MNNSDEARLKRSLDINADLMAVVLRHGDPVAGLRALLMGSVTGAIHIGITRESFLELVASTYDRVLESRGRKMVDA